MDEAISYDRLARLGFHRWWVAPVSTLAVVFAVSSAWLWISVAAEGFGTLLGWPRTTASDLPLPPLVENLYWLYLIALILPVVLAVTQLVQRRPAGTLHSVAGRVRWRWLAICMGPAAACAVLLIAVVFWLDDAGGPLLTIGWARFTATAALLVVFVPLQAAGEEYLARGFLLQTFGSYGRWCGVLVSASVFAALHGFGTWTGFVALFLGAVVSALLVVRTGGIEVALASHGLTNLLVFLVDAAGGGMDVVDDTSAADADGTTALLLVGAEVGYALIVLGVLRWLARRRPDLLPDRHAICRPSRGYVSDRPPLSNPSGPGHGHLCQCLCLVGGR